MTTTDSTTDVAPGLTRQQLAARVARDLQDGWCANLGIGVPLLVPAEIPPGREVLLHAEHGLLGVGPMARPGEEDPDLTDAGKNLVTLVEGAAAFDSATSFAIVRGGRLDVTVLGGLQVSERGDLANWVVPGRNPGVGGAMDLVAGAQRVWVTMQHVDKEGAPKLVRRCSFPLTGAGVVDRVYTDLAVFDVVDGALVLRECAPGTSVAQVERLTEAAFTVALDPGSDTRES